MKGAFAKGPRSGLLARHFLLLLAKHYLMTSKPPHGAPSREGCATPSSKSATSIESLANAHHSGKFSLPSPSLSYAAKAVAIAKSRIGVRSLFASFSVLDAVTETSQFGGTDDPRPAELTSAFVKFFFDIVPLASVSYMWNKSSNFWA